MAVIFGTRLFRKCNEIKGLGHVATKFFHIDFLPLCPLESYFVFHPRAGHNEIGTCFGVCCCDNRCCEGCPRVMKFPMSCKSILVAYFQAIAVVVGIVFSFVAFFEFLDMNDSSSYHNSSYQRPQGSVVLFHVLIAIISLAASFCAGQLARYTTFEQAKEMAQLVGSREMLVLVHVLYQGGQRAQRRDGYGGVSPNDGENDEETGAPSQSRIDGRGLAVSGAKPSQENPKVILAKAEAMDHDEGSPDVEMEMAEAQPVSLPTIV